MMNPIFEKLWYGHLGVIDEKIDDSKEIWELQKELEDAKNALADLISPKQEKAWEAYCKKSEKMLLLCREDAFSKGIRYASRYLFAALYEK